MRRRSPLGRAFVVVLMAVLCLATSHEPGTGLSMAARPLHAQSGTARPDVIIVLTDQQRADAFRAAGAADLRTPVMDRIAAGGVLFSRAFTATPQCSPSRAALLTGRYPHRTAVLGNTGGEGAEAARGGSPPAGMSAALDRSLPTLGRVFAAAGYETAYFGKWHLGAHSGRVRFRVARFHDTGRRARARGLCSSCRSGARTRCASHCS